MRIVTLAMVGGLVLAGTNPVYAQDSGDTGDAATDTSGDAASGDGASEAADGGSGQSYSTEESRFPVRRGLFMEADLGMFFTIGGRNTNRPPDGLNPNGYPARSTSNLQALVGIFLGYDVYSTDGMNLALGLKGGMMANGGAGRISEADVINGLEDPGTYANDYEIWDIGARLVADFYPSDWERVALTGKLGVGAVIFNTSPFEAANLRNPSGSGGDVDVVKDAMDPQFSGAGGAAFGAFASVAFGLTINTRLSGLTVGVYPGATIIFVPEVLVGVQAEFALKYNF